MNTRPLAASVGVLLCLGAACSATNEPTSGTPDTAPVSSGEIPTGSSGVTEPTATSTIAPAAEPVGSIDDAAATSSTSVVDAAPATTTTATTAPATAPTSEASAVLDESCVNDLTVRERAALLVWPAVYAEDWPAAVAVVRDNDVGGVLLMSQEGLDAATVAARLTELEAASRHGLIVSTDEEGGDVQRLRNVAPLSSQRIVGRDSTPDEARSLISAHGATIRQLGVDMVLGPVIDVEPNVGEVPLQPSRFFAGSPDVVSTYGEAYLTGWAQADLFATIKHYPGHGAASGDTHITAGITPSLSDLEAFDLKPYRDLRDAAVATGAAVMIGHLTVPGLTDGVPATRSPAAISYLRDDLGFGDSLLITDALGMAAVGLPEPEASVLAMQAGIDVVLFTLSSQTGAVIDAIESAVSSGALSEQHVTVAAAKVMSMLGRDGHSCDSNR